jgi:dihydroorotate dehydrogenase
VNIASLGFKLIRPALHALDAETAHLMTVRALKQLPPLKPSVSPPSLSQTLFGVRFPNPVGLAAGFDKNAEVPLQMLGLGFGFVEVGTVTPKPQPGNPRPRLFRLHEDRAVINRMGFNNEGHDAILARFSRLPKTRGVVGINIGANKDAADRIGDYVEGVKNFGAVASYLTVNISSPNTPGLRGLQSRKELEQLLARLSAARTAARLTVPLVLKIAPDLSAEETRDIAAVAPEFVDAVIVSNTTIARPELISRHRGETGGLSGAPLFETSTQVLAQFYTLTQGKIPLIGAGGISDVETAWSKLRAGASLIQIYSALVYEGPGLVERIVAGLSAKLAAGGYQSISDIVGVDATRYHKGVGT